MSAALASPTAARQNPSAVLADPDVTVGAGATIRAFASGRMHPRNALRYLAFELDTFAYVLGTGDAEAPGHDVADFLAVYNARAADLAAPPLTRRGLRREALTALANPMVASAVYGVGRYLWTGGTSLAVPALSLGGVRYLPMLRYRLAPYGTEWSLVNQLDGRWPRTDVELRVGRAPRVTPWGLRARRRDVASWRDWTLEASFDVWRQPRLPHTADERPSAAAGLGFAVRGRVERSILPVWFSADRATVVIDVGVKTSGYVPGEPLRDGIVVRGGVGLPLAP